MKAIVFAILATASRGYEYKIALADHTWTGYRQGLRYIDHIKLLSNKLSNVVGAVAGLYRLSFGRGWEVSFDLIPSELSRGYHDIFGFTLTRDAVDAEAVENLLEKSDYTNLKAMPLGFGAALHQGELRFWLKESGRSARLPFKPLVCPKVFTHTHIRVIGREETLQVFVSDADDHNATLIDCGSLRFGRQGLTGFYLTFWARSHERQWHCDVKNLLFESDIENTGIETYFSRHDHSLPRLFRRINLLRSQPQPAPASTEGLNITQINSKEIALFNHLDVANHFLASNLEQSEELLSYFDQQKKATTEFSTELLVAIRRWIDTTTEQYDHAAKDSHELTAQLVDFDFPHAYHSTAQSINDLRQTLEASDGALSPLREMAKVFEEHFDLLKSARRSLKQTPKMLAIMQQRLSNDGQGHSSIFLLVGLSTLGVLVITLQAIVLRRLKRAQQAKLFD